MIVFRFGGEVVGLFCISVWLQISIELTFIAACMMSTLVFLRDNFLLICYLQVLADRSWVMLSSGTVSASKCVSCPVVNSMCLFIALGSSHLFVAKHFV